MILVTIWFTGLIPSILVGCGKGSTPRMIEFVGKDAFSLGPFLQRIMSGRCRSITLMVHSDVTPPHATPAIKSEYLETLTRRTKEFLSQRSAFQDIVTVSP